MGRSSISFGLCEYLLSVVPISPYPLWKISASLKEGISITYGRHLFDLVPLPFTKVPHSGATFQVWQGFLKINRFHSVLSLYVNAQFLYDKLHDMWREYFRIGSHS